MNELLFFIKTTKDFSIYYNFFCFLKLKTFKKELFVRRKFLNSRGYSKTYRYYGFQETCSAV